MLKRVSLVLIMALALTFVFSGVAYANFGPHGGYLDDTDACAGCHRAHTSFLELTWTDDTIAAAEHSALLIGSAQSMSEFCNACHGDDAPGASTNVVSGVFDSGPTGPDGLAVGGDNDGVTTLYESNSTFDAVLNGGGFSRTPDVTGGAGYLPSTSAHDMDLGAGATSPMWGDGSAVPASANLTCTGCHDPHGSSNYRLLKDTVNDNVVGGYVTDNDPTPFVISAEEGYPTVGWRKHEAGAAQMAIYKPSYTAEQYATTGNDATKGLSGWCAACHEAYIIRNDVEAGTDYNYGTYIQDSTGTFQLGTETFHRHPVNVSLVAGDPDGYVLGTSWLRTAVVTTTVLPLEMADGGDAASFRAGDWDYSDYLGCLTCHVAHGTPATMAGWAEATLETTNGTDWYPQLDPGAGGVTPDQTSALLRTDNRGVCEQCHNK